MKKRLFLHVGMPKCATTTVQGYLADHAGGLAARGIQYAEPDTNRAADRGNAAPLAFAMIEGQRARLEALLDFHLRTRGDVILSSEDLFAVARGSVTGDLVAHVRKAGFEPHVICFLRRQDLWVESDYKQHVKSMTDWRDGIDTLLERRIGTQTLNYNAMLMHWARHVGHGNIQAIPLQPGQGPDYPVRAFLQAIGAADLLACGAPPPAARNVSPPAGLIEPARHLKAAMLDAGMFLPVVMAEVMRFFEQAPRVLQVPPRRFLLPLERRRRLLQRYAEANAALAKNFLGGVDAFGTDPAPDPAGEVPLAEEAAALLAAWHLRFRPGLRAVDLVRRRLSALRRGLSGAALRN